ncbi:MAG TPA: copper resistance system multicopper oxidase [Steroidobacteraceae bacterium]|nr:copper resistance system multicopper oxidase [Steroidobacteraceae bacterium]HNS27873.1 copper resistance system multicopper oxidase [Steroidobacteraceae bacterium]
MSIDSCTGVTRRRFVQGLGAGGAIVAAGGLRAASDAATAAGSPPVLSGTDFRLTIVEAAVNFTGRDRLAVTVNGSLPAPILRWREGDEVVLRVTNRLPHASTSIHWHGLLLPANMDGVPGLSFDGIAPGSSYEYRFRVRQSGTYWYHSHSLFQEQAGLYGAIIVDPREPPRWHFDREHVVLLSDWTDMDPGALFRRLKKDSSYDNYYRRTLGDFIRDARRDGLAATLAERRGWARMRMTPTDISDVNAHTYTFLMNGTTPAANWTGLFRPGEKLLLRFINGAAMTYFDVRIPGLRMTVIAADGQPIDPVTVDEFRIAVAETFDVLVEPSGQEAYTIFAQDMGRTGYARGTLATRAGLADAIPPLDPRPLLTMADMGHDGMDHSGHDMPGAPKHPASESGNPLVDMQTMVPAPRLDDPGIGLRDNGRSVLTYAAMRSRFDDPDGCEPAREIELHLTGHMEKFAWSFNGEKFMDAAPLRLRYGERLRIILVNDTMMTHPIHLHGLWSDLEDARGGFQLRKHTIDMPPGTRRSYRVRADALGRWAYHCHLLYHMEAGMMREVRVEE